MLFFQFTKITASGNSKFRWQRPWPRAAAESAQWCALCTPSSLCSSLCMPENQARSTTEEAWLMWSRGPLQGHGENAGVTPSCWVAVTCARALSRPSWGRKRRKRRCGGLQIEEKEKRSSPEERRVEDDKKVISWSTTTGPGKGQHRNVNKLDITIKSTVLQLLNNGCPNKF